MSRSSTLITVGILIILAPFAGLPSSWLALTFPILGIIVVVVGFLMRTDRIALERKTTPPAPPHEPPLAV